MKPGYEDGHHERRTEQTRKRAKSNDKESMALLPIMDASLKLLNEGKPVRTEVELRAALKAAGSGNVVTLGIQRVFGQGQKPDHFIERVRLGNP